MDWEEIPELNCSKIKCVKDDIGSIGGKFGEMRVGFHKKYGCIVAKRFRFQGRTRKGKVWQKIYTKICNEMTLRKANHDNIVQLFGMTRLSNGIAIIMEYMPNGNLNELLRNDDVKLGALLRLRMGGEIANGLSFIHNFLKDKRITHGNLTAENILLSVHLQCKIGNFRNSVRLDCTANLKNKQRSIVDFAPIYAAPELLKTPALTLKQSIDTYSFGIIVYLILKRKFPLINPLELTFFVNTMKNELQPKLDIEEVIKEFENSEKSIIALKMLATVMKDCCEHDADKRPHMKGVTDNLQNVLAPIPLADIHSQVTLATSNMNVTKFSQSQLECVRIDKLPFKSTFQSSTDDIINSSNSRDEKASHVEDKTEDTDAYINNLKEEEKSVCVSEANVTLPDTKESEKLNPFQNFPQKFDEVVAMTFPIEKNKNFKSDVNSDLKNATIAAISQSTSIKNVTETSLSSSSNASSELPPVSDEAIKQAPYPISHIEKRQSSIESQIKSSKSVDVRKNSSTPHKPLTDLMEYDPRTFYTSRNDVDIVGTGSFGVVRRCSHPRLGNVVVKCMHLGGTSGNISKSIKEVQKEVYLLSQFEHDNVVKTHGITLWGQCFGIVMEEIKCGNLHDLMIVNKEIKDIAWKLRFRMLYQLANALEYLHFHDPKKAYLHLDIKPENVLLAMNLNVKLADFGALAIVLATVAKPTSNDASSTEYSPLYTAPERLKDLFCDPEASMDVYSFAMIMYEVITRKKVFQDARVKIGVVINLIANRNQKPNMEHLDYVKKELQESSSDLEIFQSLRNIMEMCWCPIAEDRLPMNNLCLILKETAESDNPYAVETKSHAGVIAKTMFQNQKRSSKVENRVSLNRHFWPFNHAQ